MSQRVIEKKETDVNGVDIGEVSDIWGYSIITALAKNLGVGGRAARLIAATVGWLVYFLHTVGRCQFHHV